MWQSAFTLTEQNCADWEITSQALDDELKHKSFTVNLCPKGYQVDERTWLAMRAVVILSHRPSSVCHCEPPILGLNIAWRLREGARQSACVLF
jgi:hypothetical protein